MEANTPRDVESTAGATRFSDVCGTIDELKRLLVEEPEVTATSPGVVDALIDDALAMEARMETRLREYEQFRDRIVEIAQQSQMLGDSRRPEALEVAPLLRAQLKCGRSLDIAERAEAIDQAERIRDVAQDLENKLYRYKELALALEAAYRAIKGSRIWVLEGDEGEEATVSSNEPGWARWLPPSPSRERILRYLRGGRAHLLTPSDGGEGEDQPPLVQFEDGGVMPLPSVRWSEDVRNFFEAGSLPHPHGLRYRGRQ